LTDYLILPLTNNLEREGIIIGKGDIQDSPIITSTILISLSLSRLLNRYAIKKIRSKQKSKNNF